MPKFILWDVMDTLVQDPFRSEMPSFFGMTLEQLIREKHPTAWVEFEKGELTEQAFLAKFFQDGRAYDTEGFRSCVRNAYRWIDGVEELLSGLIGRYEMHTLSNYPEWYLWIEDRLELSRYVSWSFVSCRTRLRKPEPEAYLHSVRSLNCGPSDCVFVDDRQLNCEAARQIGMPAVRFEGDLEKLKRDLGELGVKG